MSKAAAGFVFFAALHLSTGYAAPRTVILLSADGFAAAYVGEPGLETTARLSREGVYAPLRPVFPSITFPSHVSMETGCTPGQHGIIANHFLDKERGEFDYGEDPSWLDCEPLWAAAERQGVKTAIVDWPVSYGKYQGVEASLHLPAFSKDRRDSERLDQIEKWLRLPEKERPRFVMSYLSGVDHVGHAKGPQSIQRKAALRKFDRTLGKFLSRLKGIEGIGEVALFLVSDHGMTTITTPVDLDGFLKRVRLGGIPVSFGTGLYVHLWNSARANEVAKELKGGLNLEAYTRETYPKKFGPAHPRMGEVIALLKPGQFFPKKQKERDPGAHGYDPEVEPKMDGVFFAWGSGIHTPLKLERVQGLDVAATVANALGIQPPKQNQGKVIPNLIEN